MRAAPATAVTTAARARTASMPVRLSLRLVALLASAAAAGAAEIVPIPQLERWERDMVTFGRTYAAELAARKDQADVDDLLLTVAFYDAARVYHQIGEYTRDASWKQAVLHAIHVYRDRFVVPAAYDIDGHLMFTHGLLLHGRAMGDRASLEAVLQLAVKERWCRDENPIPTTSPGCARENALAIMALVNAQRLGGPKRKRLEDLVDAAISHIDQWFVARTEAYIKPFFVGLEAEALIEWHAETADPRIVPALARCMDGLWDLMYVPEGRAFRYTVGSGGSEPEDASPGLNQMIAPAFAWLWRQTGDAKWLERGDALFASGVADGWIGAAKQFHQNYRWSFDYVRWRSQPPLTRARTTAKERKKAEPAKAAKPKATPADTRPSRDAVVGALRAGGLPTTSTLTLFGAQTEAEVTAADDAGIALRTVDGELHLPWAQVLDHDLARLALRARADDAAALAAAWRLAGADHELRDRIGNRLLGLDPEAFRALAGAR
ncbi:MAG TPA: hypothetical protein VEL07_23060 [Planctomycetota bacterium]|nr:hypothetical protein [Planctomycetota bacterium]